MAKHKRPAPTLWEVSDELWARIEPLLNRLDAPAATGRRRTDRRRGYQILASHRARVSWSTGRWR